MLSYGLLSANRENGVLSLLNLAVSTQNLLSQLTDTDLPAFHRQIVDFYCPRLFGNQPLTAANCAARPTFRAPLPIGVGVGAGLQQQPAAVLLGVGYWNLPHYLCG